MSGAALLKERWFSPAELANMIGLSADTLERWRSKGEGPVFIRISPRRIAYAESDVELWLQSLRTKGSQQNTEKTARPLALSIPDRRMRVLGKHRLGGHRTKSQTRTEFGAAKGLK
jgi:predicted DNA-binding transcriptional regulator AlpA